uniref:chitinase n=1 Tax=Strigamia maritima TaxID=126957 RepID=T1JDU4_STRMM
MKNVGAKKASKNSSFKIVCYYGNWAVYRQGLARFTPQNINPYLCTHIIYAFGGFNNDFELKPFDKYNDIEQVIKEGCSGCSPTILIAGNYRKFIDLKKYNPRLKTMLAIGGWNEGSARFSRLVGDSDSREIFVKSAIRYLRNYGFDGLDLDWEYPTFRDGSSLDDKEGYIMLIKELRQAFNKETLNGKAEKLLLSAAVPAGQDYIDQGFDMLEISKNVDFLNLLTYDFHTSYEPTANHHSPLYQRPNLPDEDYRANLNVDWTVRYYIQLGVPAFKIIVGIPTYGRGYTLEDGVDGTLGTPVKGPGDKGPATKESGYMAYYEICRKVREEGWTVKKPYPSDVGPYAFKGDQWVGFDDEETVINKAKYIKNKHLGGAMFWSLDNDDFRGQCGTQPNPLITAVRSVLLGKATKEKKTDEVKPKKKESDNSIPSAAASSNTESTISKSSISRRSTTRFPKFQRNPKAGRTPTREATTVAEEVDEDEFELFNTPPTPPTPDPGPAFECKDSGFYQNPIDCKKYFWCLDSGPANLGLVAHAFTCPSGLFFNKRTDACDYPNRVACKVQTHKPVVTTKATIKDDPTAESTTKKSSELADLLSLIQQLGGVDGVQKFLNKEKNEEEETTTTTKKSKALKRTTTTTTTTTTTPRPKLKAIKPRRTTVQTTTLAESNENEDEDEILSTTTIRPKTTVRKRSKGTLFDDNDDDGELFTTRRSRGQLFDDEDDRPVTQKLTRNYITIHRTTTSEPGEAEEELETTTEPTTTTTKRPTIRIVHTTTNAPATTSKRLIKVLATKPSLFRSTGIRLRGSLKRKKDEEEEKPRTRKGDKEKLRSRKDEEGKEEEEKTRRTTLRRFKLTTTTEVAIQTKSQGRRLQTRKRRPQSSTKDFETTGSRVSTTIQKAPRPFIEDDLDEDVEDDEVSGTSSGVFVSTPSASKPSVEVTSEVPFYTTHFRAGDEGVSIPTLPSLPSISFPSSFALQQFSTPALRVLNTTRRLFPTTPIPVESIEYEEQDELDAKDPPDDDEEEEYNEEVLPPTPPPTFRPRTLSTHKPIIRVTSKRPIIRITTTKPTTRRTTSAFRERVTIPPTPEAVVEYLDDDDDDAEGFVSVGERGSLECEREGIFEHPIACNKFVNCVRTMSKLRPWTYTCPPGLMYDNNVGHCNWEEQVDCGDKKNGWIM